MQPAEVFLHPEIGKSDRGITRDANKISIPYTKAELLTSCRVSDVLEETGGRLSPGRLLTYKTQGVFFSLSAADFKEEYHYCLN